MNFALNIILALFLSQIALPSVSKWEKVFKPRHSLVKSIGVFQDEIFTGTGNGVFISKNGGKSWKDFGSDKLQKDFNGNSLINWIYIDDEEEKIFIATSFGAYWSYIKKPNWQKIFEGTKTESNEVNSLAVFNDEIYLATSDGLYLCSLDENICKRLNQGLRADNLSGNYEVFSVLKRDEKTYLAGAYGIYLLDDKNLSWEDISDGIQNLPGGKINARHLFVDSNGSLWTACGTGVYFLDDENEWIKISDGIGNNAEGFEEAFYLREINNKLYAACAGGLYILDDPDDNEWKDLSFGIKADEGLEKTYWIQEFKDKNYIGTSEGLFVFKDEPILLKGKIESSFALLDGLEPGVTEVQKQALKFSSLPTTNDFKRYRLQARLRNLIPRVGVDLNTTGTRTNYSQLDNAISSSASLSNSFDADKTTRLQQDGRSYKQLSVLWNTNQLVYDGEIWEILNQARLTANVKENLLDEVTRIYFQRKKLQLENLASMPVSPTTKIANDLEIQELTGQLDSRTGGWFSKEVLRRKKSRK